MKIDAKVIGVVVRGDTITVRLTSTGRVEFAVLLGVEHSFEIRNTPTNGRTYYVGRRVELRVEPK